ncbi:MAG: hypothetical protein H2069_09150 [Legionella sp.]|nr:hypothetical protein [Legionella sp.]
MRLSKFQELPLSKELAVIALVHDARAKDPENGFLLVQGLSPDNSSQVLYSRHEIDVYPERKRVRFEGHQYNEEEINDFLKGKDCYAQEITISANQLQGFLRSIQTYGEDAQANPRDYEKGRKVNFFSQSLGSHPCTGRQTAFEWARSTLLNVLVQDEGRNFDNLTLPGCAKSFKEHSNTAHLCNENMKTCNMF